MKGPLAERSSTRSAAITAASSVLWFTLFTITSTTVFFTIGGFSSSSHEVKVTADIPKTKARLAILKMFFFIIIGF